MKKKIDDIQYQITMSKLKFYTILTTKTYTAITYRNRTRYFFNTPGNSKLQEIIVNNLISILKTIQKNVPTVMLIEYDFLENEIIDFFNISIDYRNRTIEESTVYEFIKEKIDTTKETMLKIPEQIFELKDIMFEGQNINERIVESTKMLENYDTYKHILKGKKSVSETEKLLGQLIKSQLKKDLILKKSGLAETDYRLIGFECDLPEDTIEKIYEAMSKTKPSQIITDLDNFKAIFGVPGYSVKKPAKWGLKYGKQANKAALFTFIKLMLDIKKFPREYFRKANELFRFSKNDIFTSYSYPDPKDQKSCVVTYFIPIKRIIEKVRPLKNGL